VPPLTVVLAGALASVVLLQVSPAARAGVGPGTVEVGAVAVTNGETEVGLPPLGRVVADTHWAPLRLEVRLDEIDVEQLQRTLSQPGARQAITDRVTEDLPGLLRRFVLQVLFGALVAGGVAGALVGRRRLAGASLGALGGLVTIGGLLGWTWGGYDTDAFQEARFEGALQRAPAIIEVAQRSVGDLDQVSGLVRTLSEQVSGLYAATNLAPRGGETLILHVSDLHSNPLGLEVVEQLATSFDVDAVLDTGDLTSFGNPLESRVTDLIDDIDVPYLLVPGNHDSDANRAALAASGAITLLDGHLYDVGAVRILGIGDPTFTADNEVSTEEANERKEDLSPGVVALVRRDEPDLLAVHDLRQAGGVGGWVPVVVAGHTHERSSQEEDGTVQLTVGSTGATGLGSFLVETQLAYEAQILRFDGDTLVGVDYVTLEGVSGDFTVERQVIDPPEEDAEEEQDERGDDADDGVADEAVTDDGAGIDDGADAGVVEGGVDDAEGGGAGVDGAAPDGGGAGAG
jgi:predicted phosphodiesterase